MRCKCDSNGSIKGRDLSQAGIHGIGETKATWKETHNILIALNL